LPWEYLRRRIAERWGIPPWAVDDAPQDEVNLELQVMGLEAQEHRYAARARKNQER
jgi:hypothetical protein